MMSSRRVRAPRLADVVRDLEAVLLSEFPDGLAERAAAFAAAWRDKARVTPEQVEALVALKDARKAELSRPAPSPELDRLRLELEDTLLQSGVSLADAYRKYAPGLGWPVGGRLPALSDLTADQIVALSERVYAGGDAGAVDPRLFDGGENPTDPTTTVRH